MECEMTSFDQKHDRMIEYLRAALVLADQLKDSASPHHIGRVPKRGSEP
jgi:oligoribonuclease (3'-5' exoribonuclease)